MSHDDYNPVSHSTGFISDEDICRKCGAVVISGWNYSTEQKDYSMRAVHKVWHERIEAIEKGLK